MRAIAANRVHSAGYLARKALGILSLIPPERRGELGARLAALRPDMPAIAAAVAEAVAAGDVRRVIQRSDAERRRVARSAVRALSRRRVATISNSSVVARALVYASPAHVQVLVEGRADEGHALVADLRAAGISADAVVLAALDADIAVVGCEVVYADGTFANRRGTAALVERLPTLVLVDRWKRVDALPPGEHSLSERLELVSGDRVQAPT